MRENNVRACAIFNSYQHELVRSPLQKNIRIVFQFQTLCSKTCSSSLIPLHITYPIAAQKMYTFLRSLQSQNSSLLDSLPEEQHPTWPSQDEMSSWPKRKWETEIAHIRAKIRALSLHAGFVIRAEL